MSAYVIANIDVTDPTGYEDYKRQVPATIAAFGGRYLTRGGKVEVLEGDWQPKRLVILQFPSMEQAQAWWDSTAYQGPKAIRQACSRGQLVLMEGL
jgi:uncharacterized protein (DUF1330 family)